VPAKQRVRGDDGGNLAQRPTAHPEGAHSESPPIVIGETQAPPTELPAQEAVLFNQVGERLPLAPFEPAGQGQQQHLEDRRGIHEREVISPQPVFALHNRSTGLWDRTGVAG
jgi:hypothetical protein